MNDRRNQRPYRSEGEAASSRGTDRQGETASARSGSRRSGADNAAPASHGRERKVIHRAPRDAQAASSRRGVRTVQGPGSRSIAQGRSAAQGRSDSQGRQGAQSYLGVAGSPVSSRRVQQEPAHNGAAHRSSQRSRGLTDPARRAKRSTLSARDELARETEEYHSHSRVTDRQAQTSHRNANLRGKHYTEGQEEVRSSRTVANRGSNARVRGGKSSVAGASTGMFSHGGSDYQFAGVPGAHGSASSVSGHASRSFSMPRIFGVPVPLVILAIVLVVAVAFGASQLVGNFIAGDTSSDDSLTASEDGALEYTPSVSSLDALTDPGESVATVSLLADQGTAAPTLSDESKQDIETAISAITDNDYNVGCALLDLQSGNAIVYNIDTSVYGASSFKGPYCVYLAQAKLESGDLTKSSIEERVEDAIVWSDNDSYLSLRHSNEDAELATWLESLSIDSSIASDSNHPHYTPRDSLRLWMNSYLYLFGGDSTAEYTDWLRGLFSSTEVSFLRDGISSVSKANDEAFDFDVAVSGDISDSATYTQRLMNKATQAATKTLRTDAKALAEEVAVYDKAGWIATADYSSDTDAGIIQEGDKYYLMTIMTGQPDSDGNRENVSNLASALWAAHSQLSEVTMAESDQ